MIEMNMQRRISGMTDSKSIAKFKLKTLGLKDSLTGTQIGKS